jgi:RHS repeat-associated protein
MNNKMQKYNLGNYRMIVDMNDDIVQQTNYYPYGMPFADAENAEVQPYKYNGKELDNMNGLNFYDYSARHYDPVAPHFTTVDPMAEKYYNISPYAYCAGNPVRYIDPTGMEMDWYEHENEDGSKAVIWREGNAQSIDVYGQKFDNIGETYTQFLRDGTIIYSEQDKHTVIYKDFEIPYHNNNDAQFEQRELGLMEKWSNSGNFFANFSYNFFNDIYVTTQPVAEIFVGKIRENELTGKKAFVNIDGTTNYKGIVSAANTLSFFFVSTKGAVKGLGELKALNAAEFSHTFKGTLSSRSL